MHSPALCGKQPEQPSTYADLPLWMLLGECLLPLQVGLSRLINSSTHQQSSFQLGTFEYTAPELLTGRRCSEKVCLKRHAQIAMVYIKPCCW